MSKTSYSEIAVQPLLSQLPDAPSTLFVRGSDLAELLAKPRVAIVGSRRMTPYGRAVTERLATDLAGRGVVIVNGLAYGVDICAHRAALAVGARGIAVMACGLDQIYPAAHGPVADELLQKGGAVVSEYPPNTEPLAFRFLERNRLISGLSDAVIITEAAARSGTLNTAAHAVNQGKPVFAVPGNINSPLSEGTNNLLKSGALPLTSVDDVLQHLNLDTNETKTVPVAANEAEYILLKLLQDGLTDAAQLLKQSELPTSLFNQTLTMLEITAKIKPLGANHWTLA